MKKRLMYVRTSCYDTLVSYDPDWKIVRFMFETPTEDIIPFLHHLDKVEDDSSWEMVEDVDDVEEWLGIGDNDVEPTEILDEIETELL